jgi:hypothetical protein
MFNIRYVLNITTNTNGADKVQKIALCAFFSNLLPDICPMYPGGFLYEY